MSLTYVIPDLHGRDDLLRDALAEIAVRAPGRARVVALGDYVDKGPGSRQVIERLTSGAAEGWDFVALKGNHDAMMVEALRDPAKMASWLEKGGDTALASYGGDPGRRAASPRRLARSAETDASRSAPRLCSRRRRSRNSPASAE
jgi:serine/threonine protein phosphatase 1